ncbi:DUF4244 domain-containing protein [uncultured Amnibacterium sp.]|uniref:DUF4244 domain-containing protein n=1 Tax=uncultured Amnibacterium sp. TaxID=1631851 RepID=UPI0035CBDAC6
MNPHTLHPGRTALLSDRRILRRHGLYQHRVHEHRLSERGLRDHGMNEHGAVTAEYAIATIAAVGFAALLVVVLRSDEVRGLLTTLIRHALALPA